MNRIVVVLVVALAAAWAATSEAQTLRQWDFPPGGCPAATYLPEPARSDQGTPAYYFPAHAATQDRPAFPAAITIWRVPCGFNLGFAELRMRMTVSANVSTFRPRFTIVQNGMVLGCAGVNYNGDVSQVYPGECAEFAWYTPTTFCGFISNCRSPFDMATMSGTITANLLSRSLLSSFDPDQAFTLRIRGNWPAGTPDIVYEVPARNAPGNVAAIPADMAGLWWNPAEPGWGLILDRNERGAVFAAWLTFGDDGQSTWFVMTDGQSAQPGVVEGNVHALRGEPFSTPDAGKAVAGEIVGRFQLRFTDAVNAEFSYIVNGRSARHDMQKMEIRNSRGLVCRFIRGVLQVDGLLGWAAHLEGSTSPGCAVHSTLLTYDESGKPMWVFGGLQPNARRSDGLTTSTLYGQLFRPRGTPYGLMWDSSRFAVGPAVGQLDTTQGFPQNFLHQISVQINGVERLLDFDRFIFEY